MCKSGQQEKGRKGKQSVLSGEASCSGGQGLLLAIDTVWVGIFALKLKLNFLLAMWHTLDVY